MTITQRDIATKLRVSRQLVSLALADHPAVAEATRVRIKEAAAKLGYTPFDNHAARSLIARRYGRDAPTGTIAGIVGTNPYALRAMPYFASFIEGLERETFERGFDLLFCLERAGGRLPRLVENRGVDGVVMVTGLSPELAEKLVALRLPVVTLALESDSAHSVCVDDAAGIAIAVRHLVELGHRRIGYIGFKPVHSAGRRRLDAFGREVRAALGQREERWIESDLERIEAEDAAAAYDRLVSRVPDVTAIVCYNDPFASAVVDRARATGRRVPRDLSVIGFDDTCLAIGGTPVTSIAYDREAMARRAVAVLLEATATKPTRGRRGEAKLRRAAGPRVTGRSRQHRARVRVSRRRTPAAPRDRPLRRFMSAAPPAASALAAAPASA